MVRYSILCYYFKLVYSIAYITLHFEKWIRCSYLGLKALSKSIFTLIWYFVPVRVPNYRYVGGTSFIPRI